MCRSGMLAPDRHEPATNSPNRNAESPNFSLNFLGPFRSLPKAPTIGKSCGCLDGEVDTPGGGQGISPLPVGFAMGSYS
jgi:hypothetical protein